MPKGRPREVRAASTLCLLASSPLCIFARPRKPRGREAHRSVGILPAHPQRVATPDSADRCHDVRRPRQDYCLTRQARTIYGERSRVEKSGTGVSPVFFCYNPATGETPVPLFWPHPKSKAGTLRVRNAAAGHFHLDPTGREGETDPIGVVDADGAGEADGEAELAGAADAPGFAETEAEADAVAEA